MRTIGYFIPLLIFISSLFSCSEKDEEQESKICDEIVSIDTAIFQNRPDDDGTARNAFEITNAEIQGDCLLITIASGGCNGGTWKVDLVDAGSIAESYPIQRTLKVFLDNTELCNAIVSATISFDITPLRTNDSEIILNLQKWDTRLRYTY